MPPNSARSDRGQDSKSALLKADISGRVAVTHAWDKEEPRLLIVEARLVPGTERADIRQQLGSPALPPPPGHPGLQTQVSCHVI